MDITELSRAMRAATEELEPRPGFASGVLRGARRRQVRTRIAVAGVAVVATALAGVGATAIWSDAGPRDVGTTVAPKPNPLLTSPTRGDLATDRTYLDQVIQAWRKGIQVSPNRDALTGLTGEPRVYWAGTTPAGRVAIVAQGAPTADLGTVTWPEGVTPPPDWDLQRVAVGLVTGEQATLVNDVPPISPGKVNGVAFLFGYQDHYAIAPTGIPLSLSSGFDVAQDGKGARQWTAMSTRDGVAFAEVRPGARPGDVRIATDPAQAATEDLIVLPSSSYDDGFDRQSKPLLTASQKLPNPKNTVFRIGGSTAKPLSEFHEINVVLVDAGFADPLSRMSVSGFQAVADLPGGRTMTGIEFVVDSAGSRFYAVVTERDGTVVSVTHGGVYDPNSTLPGKVELPEGTLVVHYEATLRYRTAPDGAWTDAGKDAAFLPAAATEVEVTLPGQAPKIAAV
ncbi:hypothetical protein [Actinokineospora sp.]|uniref:hypothetical protein n=1 Tax=Actinokineospora sp. TaxID=1872133 RepID=UPI0040383385